MKIIIRIILLFFSVMFCSTTVACAQDKTIKTLIITGQDGSHWWKGGSDALKQILENSGLFNVDMAITPASGEDISAFHPDFSKYKLVLINYGGKTWNNSTREDFERYVYNGGGVIIIHSSVIPMTDWKAYNEIVGLGAWDNRNEKDGPYLYWKDGKYVFDYSPGWAGHHDLQHVAVIDNRATDHPILKGLNPRWKHYKDEIYGRLRGPARNVEILATTLEHGRDEPIMWTVRPQKGRVFVSVLGHCGNDPNMNYSMKCTGYQVTLLRGAEWAATGSVTQAVPKDFPLEDTYSLRPDFKIPFNAY